MPQTIFKMPMTSDEGFQQRLDTGWTCFRHHDRFWLTARHPIGRIMIPVPPSIIDRAIAAGRAVLTGMVVTPNFAFIKETAA
ncbi:hypothetical protein [Tabrizicola sp. BL-A-41-H6]|uniref:hypothetical protein n=1 Tax=Tabrizicola sp. BL-A-41-H6 TaxID=3421107 RepID=UPI003D670DC1